MGTDPVALSDAVLVTSVASGDTAALADLYDRHSGAIYRTAFRRLGDRTLAEEVLQDTFMALWNRAELYDPSAGSLLAWLSTIARNRAIDRMRALGRRPSAIPLSAVFSDEGNDERSFEHALSAGDLLGVAAPPLEPDQWIDAETLRVEVQGALAQIPQQERQVLEMAYYEELTQTEIATRLGWPLGTVKTRTRRGLLRLRQSLVSVLGPDIAPPLALAAAVFDVERGSTPALSEARGVADGPR